MLISGYKDFNFMGGVVPDDAVLARPSYGGRNNSTGCFEWLANNVPLFNYNPITLTLDGLLLETESHTNSIKQSQTLSGWSKSGNCTLTLNALISPDGTQNAALFVPNNVSTTHWLGNGGVSYPVIGQFFNLSFFLKRPTVGAHTRYWRTDIRDSSYGNQVGFAFDFETETLIKYIVGSANGNNVDSVTLQKYPNGWYRCSANDCVFGAGTGFSFEGYPTTALGSGTTTTGDGVNGVGLYGAMLEKDKRGPPSLYIPTTTNYVTRAADVLIFNDISSWFNPDEGTILCEYMVAGTQNSTRKAILDFNDGTTGNRIGAALYSTSSKPVGLISASGSLLESLEQGAAVISGEIVKQVVRYKNTKNKFAARGEVIEDATFAAKTIPSGLIQCCVANNADGTEPSTICLRRIQYVPKIVSDEELLLAVGSEPYLPLTIEKRGQQSEVGIFIELFTLDTTSLGGGVIYWTPSRPSADKPIIWNGNNYISVDIMAEGFEKNTAGTLPRPRLSVSNADNIIGAILTVYKDLLGCTVTRTRTLYEFLDDQPSADSEQYWPLDIFKVERKVSQNKNQVVLELSAATDNAGAKIPRTAVIRDICLLAYRRFSGGSFDYTKATCPYTGATCYSKLGASTNSAFDECGKRLSDCKLRFGATGELPFGGFPGLSKVK